MSPPCGRMGFVLSLLSVVLALLLVLSLGTGPVRIAPGKVVALLFDARATAPGDADAVIVRQLRLPRVLLAAMVGAVLALCGAVMQGFFQNPMADPYIVGVSSGAALGATLALALGIDFWIGALSAVSLFAFAGALGATFLVYGISLRGGRLPAGVLLLTGVGVGALASALSSFLMLTTHADVQRILFWLMGSLAARRWEHVQMFWPWAAGGTALLCFFARDLNLLLQGEENARYMGVEVERLKRILLVASALLTAAAVAVSGIIGFVGLVVPHLMRMLVGPDHRKLLPTSMLGGAILLVGADAAARVLVAPAELPIGVITSVLGCPFFLYLLYRRRDLVL